MSVTGDPTQAVVDGIRAVAIADAALMQLLGGRIVGHVPGAQRQPYPYAVLGRRHHAQDAGAMQKDGGHVRVQIDTWSDHKGASKVHDVHDRFYQLLQRQAIAVAGYALVDGSLVRELADVSDEPDDDDPPRMLYHGVQLWSCEVHEL